MSETWEAIVTVGWVPYLAGALLSLLCGVLSVRVVLHRQVFLAAALGQTAALGIAAGLYLEISDPSWVAVLVCLGVVLLLGRALGEHATPGEIPLGVLYAAGAAGSVLLVSKSAAGREEVMHLLEGDMLFTSEAAVWRLAFVTSVLFAALAAGGRHLTLVGFDPEGAQAAGYRLVRWRLALLTGLALAVALGMETGGLLLTFGCLVLPGAIALRLAPRLAWAAPLAGILAVVAQSVAYVASFHPGLNLPPAASTITLLVAGYVLVRTFGPPR